VSGGGSLATRSRRNRTLLLCLGSVLDPSDVSETALLGSFGSSKDQN
jgi:hypothetical protein